MRRLDRGRYGGKQEDSTMKIALLVLLAAAAAEQKQKIASVRYLVGTWKCEHTVGTFSGTYTTKYATAMDDVWLRQTYEFPDNTAEALMVYSPQRKYWVRFFGNSEGLAFAIRMTDTPTGWAWKYVSIAKDRKPETMDPDATFTRRSDTEYAIDGPSYPKDGVQVTEHHVCKKL
jgi:hypothetical protein